MDILDIVELTAYNILMYKYTKKNRLSHQTKTVLKTKKNDRPNLHAKTVMKKEK